MRNTVRPHNVKVNHYYYPNLIQLEMTIHPNDVLRVAKYLRHIFRNENF